MIKQLTANEISIGERFNCHETASISCDKLVIGSDVEIGPRTVIKCKGIVMIGDCCLIGNDVNINCESFAIGDYSKLHNHSLLNGKNKVSIGENCWIGQNCILNCEAKLSIGNNVGIGTYSSVWTHGYFGELVEGCSFYSIKPTILEDDVWLIGSYNTVFPGVTIGKGAVVMGASVVTKSISERKVFGGNPATDLSHKLEYPYKSLSFDEKVEVIRTHLTAFLENRGIEFKEGSDGISINNYGVVFFSDNSLADGAEGSVGFYDCVSEWSDISGHSKFCLTTKRYQKKYSPLEILVKKALNPVAARFVKLS